MILLIDNYDSFSYNLFQMMGEIRPDILVIRNDQMSVQEISDLSPEKIVLGGGVMHQEHVFPKIRREVLKLLNGYVQHTAILDNIETYIVEPGLGTKSGATGALLLAREAYNTFP